MRWMFLVGRVKLCRSFLNVSFSFFSMSQSLECPLVQALTQRVNQSFESGEMHHLVSPVTAELLKFWFDEAHMDTRKYNFHEGQKQAILNTVYVHEVLKPKNLQELYMSVDPQLILHMPKGVQAIGSDQYQFPRYCMKMATGTGKTWVMHALLLWQYLNSQRGNG